MKLYQDILLADRLSPTETLRADSGRYGVEIGCNAPGQAVLLDRDDAIRLARWILDVCDAWETGPR